MVNSPILLVNFGGPRSLEEVRAFLTELLLDRDVVRTRLPSFVHNYLFRRVARKRAEKIRHDYQLIGGKSPIYFDTEEIAKRLTERLNVPVFTFHRYLAGTHEESLRAIEESGADEIRVVPLFPQFSYATTGSIARFFVNRLSRKTLSKLRWVQSYAGHVGYIRAYQRRIGDFLRERNLLEDRTLLLFSAHGLPKSFVSSGDPYGQECELSYREIMKAFPRASSLLAYQSKFGKGEWLRPYTDETCQNILTLPEKRDQVVIVPLSFTSDHIETLFEIEKLSLPALQANGIEAHRCPALNLEPYWIEALAEIASEQRGVSAQTLVRGF